MTFTQIPPEYAPLSGELRYTVTTQETATLDLRIADAGNGTLIGAKRFAGATAWPMTPAIPTISPIVDTK